MDTIRNSRANHWLMPCEKSPTDPANFEEVTRNGFEASGNSSNGGQFALKELLRGLDPYLRPGVWVYVELPKTAPCPAGTEFTVLEDEGRTIVLLEEHAKSADLQPLFKAAWITLRVHSALEAVGLVAKIASSLAGAGIPCNAVAGARHDHILVPKERAQDAMEVLNELQQKA